MKRVIVFMMGIALLWLTGTVWAGDTLLKALQNKGVITEEEASTVAQQSRKRRGSLSCLRRWRVSA